MGAIPESSSSKTSMQTWRKMMPPHRLYLNQLASTLQSGNLTDSPSAFSALQSLNPHGQNSSFNPTGASSNSSTRGNAIPNDFDALGQALHSRNIANAHSDYAQLQTRYAGTAELLQ
jgi:hypothetical protein